MKASPAAIFSLAILAGFALPASAASSISGGFIDYVTVGNPGNAPDPATGSHYGAVAYEYLIAKNETTIAQYCEFLNAKATSDPYGLYGISMTSRPRIAGISRTGSSGSYSYSVIGSTANKPITYVGWFDAARFCNWLHNGQGSGDTETGAYTLNGALSGIYMVNPGAKVWIPTEDEWYKAAYYDPTKDLTGGYWLYPTQSDSLAGNTIGVPKSANYFDGDYVGSGTATRPTGMALTDVGAYGENSASFYGTNDQGGNVKEFTDAVITYSGWQRGLRGGSWDANGGGGYSASRDSTFPGGDGGEGIGFRVASVPEPSCVFLTLLASGVLVTRRKR